MGNVLEGTLTNFTWAEQAYIRSLVGVGSGETVNSRTNPDSTVTFRGGVKAVTLTLDDLADIGYKLASVDHAHNYYSSAKVKLYPDRVDIKLVCAYCLREKCTCGAEDYIHE